MGHSESANAFERRFVNCIRSSYLAVSVTETVYGSRHGHIGLTTIFVSK